MKGQRIEGDGVSPDLDAQQRTQAGQTGGVSTGTIRNHDVGEGERATVENADHAGILFGNHKRTADEFQKDSLQHAQNAQTIFQQASLNLQGQLAQLNAVTTQAIQNAVAVTAQAQQNAVENANLSAKQAVRHGDIAIDNQWNPVQQGAGDTLTARAVNLDDATLKAIGAAVSAAVVQALSGASAAKA